MVKQVYEGLRAAGVDKSWCTRWLNRVRSRVESLTVQVGQVKDPYRRNVDSSLLRVRAMFVTFAVESGDLTRARQRLREFMACRKSVARDQWRIAQGLRKTVVEMADGEVLQQYDRWLADLTTPVRQIELKWNDYPVYEKARVALKPARFLPMLPIVASPEAVYFVLGAEGPEELAGWADKRPARHMLMHMALSDDVDASLPAVPVLDKDFAVTGAEYLDGKLYVSTKRTGLMVCDIRAGKWQQIGPAQGLADWYVYFVHALDEKTLLVVTGHQDEDRTAYSKLDVTTGKITLVHRLDGKCPLFVTPTAVWWADERLMAMNNIGLAQDMLKVPPEFQSWPDVWPHGWQCRPRTWTPKPNSIAVLGDKRYVMAATGLHEISDDGRVLRSWWNRMTFNAGRRVHDNLAMDCITTPGDFPSDNVRLRFEFVTNSEEHLLLLGQRGEVLCYEPISDTWFGPIQLPAVGIGTRAIGTIDGAWIGGSEGAVFVRTTEIIAAAKEAKRVMTSREIRKRKREQAEQAGPLAAATFALLTRDFDRAQRLAEAILTANPKDAKAILLMALLHDFWCLDRPEEALAWYDKLSTMDDNPSAIYTGLYAKFRMSYTLRRWEQAIAAGELLLDKVPCLYAGMTPEVERFMEYTRQRQKKDERRDSQ